MKCARPGVKRLERLNVQLRLDQTNMSGQVSLSLFPPNPGQRSRPLEALDLAIRPGQTPSVREAVRSVACLALTLS